MVVSPFRVVVGTYTSVVHSVANQGAKPKPAVTGNGILYRSNKTDFAAVLEPEEGQRQRRTEQTRRSRRGRAVRASKVVLVSPYAKDKACVANGSDPVVRVTEGFAQAQVIYGKLLLHHAACTVTTANPDWLRLLDVEREWTEERRERVKGAPWERCSMSRKRRSRRVDSFASQRASLCRNFNGWPTRSINLACVTNAAVLHEHACCQLLHTLSIMSTAKS
ncbi:hypothetical protein GE21DRAFT_1269649 [Neurospora crassa]|nr:hypothetical protein GE21DRAFT_1269649 [Neurospora crassa]